MAVDVLLVVVVAMVVGWLVELSLSWVFVYWLGFEIIYYFNV